MYDIVKQESHQDTTWYWCIRDNQETAPFANLDETVSKALAVNPAQQASHDLLKRFLDSLYFFTTDTALINFTTVHLSIPVFYKKKV